MKTKEEIQCDLEDCPVKLDKSDIICLTDWIYDLLQHEAIEAVYYTHMFDDLGKE